MVLIESIFSQRGRIRPRWKSGSNSRDNQQSWRHFRISNALIRLVLAPRLELWIWQLKIATIQQGSSSEPISIHIGDASIIVTKRLSMTLCDRLELRLWKQCWLSST